MLLKKAILIGVGVSHFSCHLENLLIFSYLWKVLSISPLTLLSWLVDQAAAYLSTYNPFSEHLVMGLENDPYLLETIYSFTVFSNTVLLLGGCKGNVFVIYYVY